MSFCSAFVASFRLDVQSQQSGHFAPDLVQFGVSIGGELPFQISNAFAPDITFSLQTRPLRIQLVLQLVNLRIQFTSLCQLFGDGALIFTRLPQLLITGFDIVRLRDDAFVLDDLVLLPFDLRFRRRDIMLAGPDAARHCRQIFSFAPQ